MNERIANLCYPWNMLQPTLFPPPSLSVSEITRYLRELFETDEI